MANKDLSGEPHNLSEKCWWYEEPGGICLVIRRELNTETYTIDWRTIRAALKRKDRKEPRR